MLPPHGTSGNVIRAWLAANPASRAESAAEVDEDEIEVDGINTLNHRGIGSTAVFATGRTARQTDEVVLVQLCPTEEGWVRVHMSIHTSQPAGLMQVLPRPATSNGENPSQHSPVHCCSSHVQVLLCPDDQGWVRVYLQPCERTEQASGVANSADCTYIKLAAGRCMHYC